MVTPPVAKYASSVASNRFGSAPCLDQFAQHGVDQVGDGWLVAQQDAVDEQLLGVDDRGVQVQPHGHGQALAASS